MKLMYAVRGEGLGPRVLSASFRSELAATGVHRLQVNLDDDHVRDARLRLSTRPEPVRAVVSAWTHGEGEPVTRLLSSAAVALTGWAVEEHCPLPPPVTTEGERAKALANVAFLRVPEGMSHARWLDRWRDQHTQVAIETQATFGYVQNLVLAPVTAEDEQVAAVVEELFPLAAMTDHHAFYGSGGDDAELRRRMSRMMESTRTFGASRNLDLVPTSRFVFRLG